MQNALQAGSAGRLRVSPFSRTGLIAVTAISTLFLLLVTWTQPQGINSDPAFQLKAVQQYLDGISPSINHVVLPDSTDISRDRLGWIIWWSPGTNLLAYPLLASGFTIGDAVRVLTAFCLLAGSIGWVWWFSRFKIPALVNLLFALFIAWARFRSNTLFVYTPEILVYASVPWLLLCALQLGKYFRQPQDRLRWAFACATVLGLLMGGMYILKYAALFISVGAGAYLALLLRRNFSWRALLLLAWAGLLCAVPVGILTVLNQNLGGEANLVATSTGNYFRWETLLHAVANPAMIAGDAFSLWDYLFFNSPALSANSETYLGVVGLLPGLLLIWLALLPSSEDADVLARVTFFTSLAIMIVIWSFSDSVSYEPRHLSAAGLAVLPLLLQQGWRLLKQKRRGVNVLLVAVFFGFVVVPFGYGVVSVAGKVLRTSPNYVTGRSDLYNALLAATNINAVRDDILESVDVENDVLYVTSPVSALDLSGRLIMIHADFTPIEQLRSQQFTSSVPLRVHLLLPTPFEANGKGDVIRGSFPGAGNWTERSIGDSNLILWTADLAPQPA
jgi:hypothetical protein